jgi:hypothetical protein
MTPKEKAKQLVDRYNHHELLYWHLTLVQAKQCVLIAVDEIIAQIEPSVSMDVISARINYWQQVKQEINLL